MGLIGTVRTATARRDHKRFRSVELVNGQHPNSTSLSTNSIRIPAASWLGSLHSWVTSGPTRGCAAVPLDEDDPAPVLGRERARLPGRQRMHQLIVRAYKVKSRPIAAKAFSQDAEKLAGQGYIVVLQSWEAGKTGAC